MLDEQAPHDFPPDRPGQFPLKEALEYGHFARIVAILPHQCRKIGFLGLERMLRTKFRQRGENLVEQNPGIGDGGENKLDFVDVQYHVLRERLGRRKETALDAARVQHREDIRKVIDVPIVKRQ